VTNSFEADENKFVKRQESGTSTDTSVSLNRKASTESHESSSSEEADGEALAETPAPPSKKKLD